MGYHTYRRRKLESVYYTAHKITIGIPWSLLILFTTGIMKYKFVKLSQTEFQKYV